MRSLLLYAALLARPACAADPAVGKAHEFLADWRQRDLAAMYADLTPAFQKSFPFAEFKSFWKEAPLKILSEKTI